MRRPCKCSDGFTTRPTDPPTTPSPTPPQVIVPEGIESQCCGMLFNSRGFKEAAAVKCSDLERVLLKASDNGKIPIVMDTSPCLMQVKQSLSDPALRFALYEPVEFIRHFLLDKLDFEKKKASVYTGVETSF